MTNATWEFEPPADRIVAVGDVHGDQDALLRILVGAGLVDEKGDWIGAGCHLVQMGDLVDRGPDSVACMSYAMRLEQQAAACDDGSRVTALLGNHEQMAAEGEYLFIDPDEAAALADFRFGSLKGLDAVFRGDSPWASWMRSRCAVIRVGSTLFAHAGLDGSSVDLDPGRINAGVQAWIAHAQGVGPRPAESSAWLTEFSRGSPLWTRAYMAWDRAPSTARVTFLGLQDVLARTGAKRLVVGHSPTVQRRFEIAWPHPQFGAQVAVIDTGISRYYASAGGRLSALRIVGDTLAPLYFERGDMDLPATAAIRDRFEQARRHTAEVVRPGRG